MKRLQLLFTAFLAVWISTTAALPAAGFADTPKATVCQTLGSGSDCQTTPANSVSLTHVIAVTVNVLSIAAGVAAVIMIMIGGFRYITSNGDSNTAKSARNTVLYSLIGIVIVVMAQIIVQFVLFRLK